MKQIVAIHGGDSFATYEDFLRALNECVLDPTPDTRKGWKSTLNDVLGEAYDVLLPRMPNSQNAKYLEWKIWFEKYIPYIEDDVMLIGHSLGGCFLAKYLSEEKLPRKIKAVFLVAVPFVDQENKDLIQFALPSSLKLLSEQGGELYLYHSEDDPVVPFSELSKFQTALPGAHVTVFKDRQHFNQEEFPEIVEAIRSLG